MVTCSRPRVNLFAWSVAKRRDETKPRQSAPLRQVLGRKKMSEERIVLCGANAYEQKYYFNKDFDKIPQSIKDELHIICVLFTQEVGGIFTIVFEEDGSISLETNAEEDDITYDEISSGLLINEIRRKRQELFESLQLYYKVFVKKEDVSELLSREDL